MSGNLLRLRPIVHATPTATGLHVRGWRSSFSLDGGKGLWTIWERLAGPLADGVPPAQLAVPENAPPAVARALELLIGQLHEHDMLVEVPAEWGGTAPPEDIASWLESVAASPVEAWRRLRSATVTVTGEGALAAHAHRALVAAGVDVAPVRPGAGLLVVVGPHAVAAGCAADVGFVVAPGSVVDVAADAVAVAERLAGAPGAPPEVLAALVGSAAAHRLVCALGGLPDPSTEVVDMWSDVPPAGPPHQAVLVARVDPLHAEYHPWLSAVRPREPGGAVLEVLGDRELGPVPTPLPGELPQLPVKLAAAGDVVGFGATEHAARLDALLRAARALAPDGVVLGADRVHALGLALRTAVRPLHGTPVAEDEWAADPTARRWWKAVTLRFALPAEVEVTRLGPRVVRAVVRAGGEELSWAVESEPADAVAFAAMAAAGRTQAETAARAAGADGKAQAGADAGAAPAQPVVLCGAAPFPEPDGAAAPWTTRDWHWPYGLRDGEEAFQDDLRALAADVKPVHLGPVLEAAGVVAFAVEG
ncbi:hypothetical protein ADK67_29235 [Saccharothrix sp. NRRL B-16348]|uniref:hypothetical protein n=1 Tax=Saccharothrix sp. NRRL B-16348 TaxID=1415542 RepID=UPI0006AF8ED4|nr:hypothetical protein [Saccharothrix sp. NRRL B-16348]KOX20425.1 hypothetical protein ADK67_29235 [Saccharothrix sp. NRRL B-16348]